MLKNLRHKIDYAIHELLLETQLVSNIGSQVVNNQVNQTQLLLQYQQIVKLGLSAPQLQDTGFRVYSQNDEDGLLLYIFSLIGTTNKICVDLAFGSPYGANTTNLLVNWGWHGLLIEGSQKLINISNKFFGEHPDTWIYPPQTVQSWVTTENINVLLE